MTSLTIRRFLQTQTAMSANVNKTVRGSQQSKMMMFQATRFFNSDSNSADDATTTPSLIDKSNNYLCFNTLHELAFHATIAYGNKPLFGTFVGPTKPTIISGNPRDDDNNGNAFHWMTYTEFGKNVALCRIILKQLGVRPHSKVGIISSNRHEWATIAAATYSLNAALVPMYEAQLPKDWTHILNDSECSVLFCSTEDIYLKAKKEVLPTTPMVREVLCFDAPDGEPHSFTGAMADAEQDMGADNGVVVPTEDDLANLIYTRYTSSRNLCVQFSFPL